MRKNWHFKLAATCIIIISVSFVAQGFAETSCVDLLNPPRRVCESGIPSTFVDIPAQTSQQFQSEWCWAASISMVFKYYGHPVSQDRIVTQAYGGPANMPAQPWTMLSMLNRTWIDDNGHTFTSVSSPGSTNAVAAANDLAADMPLLVGTQGHAVVLTSLQYAAFYLATTSGPQLGPVNITNAIVRDPWPGRGRRSLSPLEWATISFAVQIRIHDGN